MKAGGAGQVEKGFIDRQRFDQGRDVLHHVADTIALGGILAMVGADHHGIGTGLQRLEHRHRRADAIETRDITTRGYDPPFSAAHNDWSVFQGGIVAFFDGCKEGVAIEMSDGQRCDVFIADYTMPPAARAGSAVVV